MQSMTMTLSRRCMYAKLHVIWSKSLLYIFSLINHTDSLRIQALSLNPRHRTSVFLCFFALFTFYSFVLNSHFLVAIRVFFKYSSVAILSILMMNSVNIVSVFLSWAFSLSFTCSSFYSSFYILITLLVHLLASSTRSFTRSSTRSFTHFIYSFYQIFYQTLYQTLYKTRQLSA